MLKGTILALMALLATLSFGGEAAHPTIFQGEIADSSCALNVHSLTRSHQEMLKNKSMGGTSSSCSQYCVRKLGADYVLVSGDKVFRLEGQPESAWQTYAGEKVTINGTLDGKTNTIHVEHVESSTDPKHRS